MEEPLAENTTLQLLAYRVNPLRCPVVADRRPSIAKITSKLGRVSYVPLPEMTSLRKTQGRQPFQMLVKSSHRRLSIPLSHTRK
jgi:hypothetical protein